MNTNDPASGSRAAMSARTRMLLVAAAVALALILGIYLWGKMQARDQLSAQEQAHQQQVSTLQAELAEVRNSNQLLAARADLYRAAADLDQRNFGMANTRLQSAASALGRVEGSSGAPDPARLEALRASLQGLNINVAANLEDQRNRVLNLAAQLDGLVQEPVPPGEKTP